MAKDNIPHSNRPKFNPWLLYLAVIMLFLFIGFLSGGNSFSEPVKISLPKFDSYLNNGDVEKVIIYNNTEGEVFLTPEAIKSEAHKTVAKDMLSRTNEGPHYVLDIGNDEIFQKKLDEAVQAEKLKDFSFQSRSNWSDILISLLPIIIIVAIWIFIMRRM